MGIYDDLRCHYPLPVPGANARSYQTKDTPCQSLNKYEITAEGVLRHKEWNSEEGLGNKWIGHPDFMGEICFYDCENDGARIEFSAYFVNGLLRELRLISNTTDPPHDSQETTMPAITNPSNSEQGEIYLNGQKIAKPKNVTFAFSPSTLAPVFQWPQNPGDPADPITWLRESGETAESNGFTSQAKRFAHSANLIEQLQQELAECDRERLHLATKIADERQSITELACLARKQHYYCEDSWYSCPKATDGCANDSEGDECNCGADEHNAKVDALMQQLKSSMD